MPEQTQTLEERLQPWIDQAEYLIALTLIIMAWAAGWVDFLAFESFTKTVFGRYSVPFFAMFAVYSLGFILWFWLFTNLDALDRFKKLIAYIQRTPLLALIIMAIAITIYWTTLSFAFWALMPLLQGAVIVFVTVLLALILFSNPDPETATQTWRKVVNGAMIGFVGIEIILHILAAIGISPLQNTGALFEPYSTIYQNQEGHTYGLTNENGWYYPNFEALPDDRNIILVGDSYVQALQVSSNQHMATRLDDLINDPDTNIMPTGMVDYGAGTYTSTPLYQFIWQELEPDEIVLFVHLANDFQFVTEPQSERPYYFVDDAGIVRLHPDDALYGHIYEHVVFDGHQPPYVLESIFSYSFLISALREQIGTFNHPPVLELRPPEQEYLREYIPVYQVEMPIASRSAEMPFGENTFIFEVDSNEQAETAYTIMFGQLARFTNFMAQRDISVRIVTIPFFPESFYASQSGTTWETTFDNYDILLPEQRLVDFANENDIPIIATGAMLQSQGLMVSDIQALYFNDGVGRFTAEGHQFMADLLNTCFYSETDLDCTQP